MGAGVEGVGDFETFLASTTVCIYIECVFVSKGNHIYGCLGNKNTFKNDNRSLGVVETVRITVMSFATLLTPRSTHK